MTDPDLSSLYGKIDDAMLRLGEVGTDVKWLRKSIDGLRDVIDRIELTVYGANGGDGLIVRVSSLEQTRKASAAWIGAIVATVISWLCAFVTNAILK